MKISVKVIKPKKTIMKEVLWRGNRRGHEVVISTTVPARSPHIQVDDEAFHIQMNDIVDGIIDGVEEEK